MRVCAMAVHGTLHNGHSCAPRVPPPCPRLQIFDDITGCDRQYRRRREGAGIAVRNTRQIDRYHGSKAHDAHHQDMPHNLPLGYRLPIVIMRPNFAALPTSSPKNTGECFDTNAIAASAIIARQSMAYCARPLCCGEWQRGC